MEPAIDTINASDMRDEFVNLNILDTFAGGGANCDDCVRPTNLLRELVRMNFTANLLSQLEKNRRVVCG